MQRLILEIRIFTVTSAPIRDKLESLWTSLLCDFEDFSKRVGSGSLIRIYSAILNQFTCRALALILIGAMPERVLWLDLD